MWEPGNLLLRRRRRARSSCVCTNFRGWRPKRRLLSRASSKVSLKPIYSSKIRSLKARRICAWTPTKSRRSNCESEGKRRCKLSAVCNFWIRVFEVAEGRRKWVADDAGSEFLKNAMVHRRMDCPFDCTESPRPAMFVHPHKRLWFSVSDVV